MDAICGTSLWLPLAWMRAFAAVAPQLLFMAAVHAAGLRCHKQSRQGRGRRPPVPFSCMPCLSCGMLGSLFVCRAWASCGTWQSWSLAATWQVRCVRCAAYAAQASATPLQQAFACSEMAGLLLQWRRWLLRLRLLLPRVGDGCMPHPAVHVCTC